MAVCGNFKGKQMHTNTSAFWDLRVKPRDAAKKAVNLVLIERGKDQFAYNADCVI